MVGRGRRINLSSPMKKFYLPIWAVIFSLWLPLYAGYLSFDILSDVDFLSSVYMFENPDDENTAVDQQSRGKSLPGMTDVLGRFEKSHFFEPLLGPGSVFIFPLQLPSPLRC